jgi:glycosyltransferase involved in cell wall biosynthesis
VNVSVILCTHNPRPDYLLRCLDALREQTLGQDQWELIVVDNRSDEPVGSLADLSWHVSGRLVREETLGLTPARLRGISESTGDLLVFVDDDNVLDPDFLEVALRVAAQKPFLGSWSGQCRPCFDRPPPEWSRRYWGNLVIREFQGVVWSNLPRLPQSMPCGAGLCVRRDVAAHYLHLHQSGQRTFQLDRHGDSLTSGGDNDLAACACDLGLGLGLVAPLKLTHLIPPERLTEDYLARLADDIVFSAVVLAHIRGSWQEIALYRVRWHEPLRAMLAGGPHRRIQRASIRGRRRGLEFITALGRTASAALDRADLA